MRGEWPSFWAAHNRLSFQRRGADAGLGGGVSSRPSRGCRGTSSGFPVSLSSPARLPPDFGLRLPAAAAPAPPGSRSVCVAAGWGTDPEGEA